VNRQVKDKIVDNVKFELDFRLIKEPKTKVADQVMIMINEISANLPTEDIEEFESKIMNSYIITEEDEAIFFSIK